MLAKRIIPMFLQRGHSLVKGQQFKSWRSVGHVRQAVSIYQARGVDEIIYLDIEATPKGRGPDLEMVKQLTADCYSPITVGGGVKTVFDIKGLLNAGADKVAIGTAAMEDQTLIQEAVKIFGSQAIVVAIDYKDGQVMTRCGTMPWEVDPVSWAMAVEEAGAGEILLTSIEHEGVMEGYDTKMIEYVTEAVSIPVIASGGCGDYPHMTDAINAGASAVAAGSLFQFKDCTPRDAAKWLARDGIEVRI